MPRENASGLELTLPLQCQALCSHAKRRATKKSRLENRHQLLDGDRRVDDAAWKECERCAAEASGNGTVGMQHKALQWSCWAVGMPHPTRVPPPMPHDTPLVTD